MLSNSPPASAQSLPNPRTHIVLFDNAALNNAKSTAKDTNCQNCPMVRLPRNSFRETGQGQGVPQAMIGMEGFRRTLN